MGEKTPCGAELNAAAAASGGDCSQTASDPTALPPAAGGAWAQGLADLREGWAYMTAPGNRDVAVFTLIKASGAFVWGASDVLYVK